MAKLDTFFGDPTKLVDSPNLPDGEAVFSVTMDGLKD
jgi:hypothetical protein